MRTRVFFGVLSLTVLMILVGGSWVGAQQAGQKEMTAEQKAMMEQWQKMATPAEGHKRLEPVVGDFSTKVTMWETPGQAGQTSAGSAKNEWVLGGRFVRETFHGEYMGMPFDGVGFTGYDNYKKKYIGSWVDSMGTAMMTLTGTVDASGKVFTMLSDMDDFMTGKVMKVRAVTRIVDANQHVFEMYGPDPKGKEFKMMEIVYTRK
jgi:Protein of unknown function (DUF1579)